MKTTLLSGFLVLALALSGCQNNSDPTGPASPSNEYSTAVSLLDKLDLSNDQIAFVDEMYYMDEDMSVLLDDGQTFTFTQMTDGMTDKMMDRGPNDRKFPGPHKLIVDMDALMYFRLIMKACPDHSAEELAAIRQLIAESTKARAELVRNATDKAALLAALQAEHDALMAAINTLIGQDCVDAVEALKAEIQAKRDEHRQKLEDRRIQAELAFFTKLLGLTEEQIALVKELILAKHARIAELREQYKDDPEGLRAALLEYMESFDAAMLVILDDDQDVIYENWRNRTTGHKPDPNDHVQAEIDRLTKLLGLTPDQVTTLKALIQKKMEAEKTAIQTIGKDRAELAKAMQAINQEYNEAFLAMLTPEQLEIWKKFHQKGPGHIGPRGG